MTVAVEAVYENGVLRPEKPLDLKEHAKVRVIIEGESANEAPAQDDDPTGWKTAQRFIGLWKDAPAGEAIAAEHDQQLYK